MRIKWKSVKALIELAKAMKANIEANPMVGSVKLWEVEG